MLRIIGSLAISIGALWPGTASAGIPEPDVIIFGGVTLSAIPVQQRDAVVVRARLAGGPEIGRYDFGDCNADGVRDACELSCANPGCTGVAGCGTARDTSPADGLLDNCPGHLYVLKIRCESTPNGVPPSGNAAVLNPSNPTIVHISAQMGNGPEMYIRDLLISERGRIQEIALSILNLFTLNKIAACCSGPDGVPPGGSCDAAQFVAVDYDDDGDVDLADYAFLQNQFVDE